MRSILLLFPFYRWWSWDMERLCNGPSHSPTQELGTSSLTEETAFTTFLCFPPLCITSINEGLLLCNKNFCPRMWDFSIWIGSFTWALSLNSNSFICIDWVNKRLPSHWRWCRANLYAQVQGFTTVQASLPPSQSNALVKMKKAVKLTALGN